MSTRDLVEAVDVAVALGGRPVLNGVDLSLSPGDRCALVGRSGSGKSTLLLLLAGLLRPDRGHVAWPALAGDAALRRRQVAVVFQAPSLVPELTAAENVALPLRLAGRGRAAAEDAAAQALTEVELADTGAALPHELSGGQQQRVALARALAGSPLVLLADEPTGALDPATASRMVGLLERSSAAREGVLVVATHDRELAALLPRRLDLADGRVREQRRAAPADRSVS